MSDVAIIHAPEDALPARALAEKLRQARLSVVIEKPPGEELRNAVKDAKVAIALWSPRSAGQPVLAEDAAFARTSTTLIHVTMQNAAAPHQFAAMQSINLTGWRGEDDFPAWRTLAKLVTERVGVASPPRAQQGAGFFTPGRASAAAQPQARPAAAPGQTPPRPQPAPPRSAPPRPKPVIEEEGQSGAGGRGLLWGAIGLAAVLALGGGYFFLSQSQNTSVRAADWNSIDTSDAEALRAFISGRPGEFKDEAEAALATLEERSFEAASDEDSIEALETFAREFPDSEHLLVARGRIAELRAIAAEAPPPAPAVEEVAPDPDLVPPGTDAAASSDTPLVEGEAPLPAPEDPPQN